RLRRALSVPGLTAEQTVAFRDKQRMKEVLDAAGIRTPHHYRARTAAEVRDAIARIGFPAIVKPIAGAGAADTHRVDRAEDVERALRAVRTVPEVSAEKYTDGRSSPTTRCARTARCCSRTSRGTAPSRSSRASTRGSARRPSSCATSRARRS